MNVRFPDGTTVRALSLRERKVVDPTRDYGLYLDPSWAPTWDAFVIAWEDFGLPDDERAAAARIVDAFHRARSGETVEIGCIGGRGRTGTVLACMAVLAGVTAGEAVAWVREHVHPEAIETAAQASWVEHFARHLRP